MSRITSRSTFLANLTAPSKELPNVKSGNQDPVYMTTNLTPMQYVTLGSLISVPLFALILKIIIFLLKLY